MATEAPQVLLAEHTPATVRDADGAVREYDPALKALDYQGALEQRWGIVTPFHKINAGLWDKTVKDTVTLARLYIDFPPTMTQKQREAIPVHPEVKPFLTALAGGQSYILMLIQSVDYSRPEKLQSQTVHEDNAVFNTSGQGIIPVSISAMVYNTPTDPWARYLDLLWRGLFRASQLAKWKLRLRLHFFDKVIYLIPGNVGFSFRATNQEVASVTISGFAHKVLYVPPVLETESTLRPLESRGPFGGSVTRTTRERQPDGTFDPKKE